MKSRTCPYRPQSDGMIERLNRTIQELLSLHVSENRDDWDDHLPYIMMAYRATRHSSTGETPNMMFLASDNRLPIDLMYPVPTDSMVPQCPQHYILWVEKSIACAHERARKYLQKSATRQKRNYDKDCKILTYNVGQKVYRYYIPCGKQKLGCPWTGPYTIVNKINDLHYEIKQENSTKTIRVHIDHLKAFKTNEHYK